MGIFSFLKKKESSGFKGTETRIIVYRRLGDSTPTVVASFIAVQKKDSKNFNLQLVNEDFSFKEDISNVKDQLINFMENRLDLAGKDEEKRKEIIKKTIKKQEQKITRIRNGLYYPEEVVKDAEDIKDFEEYTDEEKNKIKEVNKLDEENKLRAYKVLLDTVKYQDDGSYEEFDENGQRLLRFDYRDGVVYPIFWTKNKNLLTVDVASKRKIHADTSEDINREFLEETSNPMKGFFGKMLMVILIAMIIANIVWSNENMRNMAEFQEMLDNSKLQKLVDQSVGAYTFCSATYRNLLENNQELITYAIHDINNKSVDNPPKPSDIETVVQIGDKVN